MGCDKIDRVTELDEFLNFSVGFRQNQLHMGQQVSSQLANMNHEIGLANNLALSVLYSTLCRSIEADGKSYSEAEYHSAAIVADFAKSIAAFEFSINAGLYGAASTLVRREIEAVNNCYAHRLGKQKDKHNPRVKPLKALQEIYKKLTGIAHNADREGMSYLAGGRPASIDPSFNCEYTEHLIMTHVLCMSAISLEVSHGGKTKNGLDRDEEYYQQIALGILVEKGFLVQS